MEPRRALDRRALRRRVPTTIEGAPARAGPSDPLRCGGAIAASGRRPGDRRFAEHRRRRCRVRPNGRGVVRGEPPAGRVRRRSRRRPDRDVGGARGRRHRDRHPRGQPASREHRTRDPGRDCRWSADASLAMASGGLLQRRGGHGTQQADLRDGGPRAGRERGSRKGRHVGRRRRGVASPATPARLRPDRRRLADRELEAERTRCDRLASRNTA